MIVLYEGDLSRSVRESLNADISHFLKKEEGNSLARERYSLSLASSLDEITAALEKVRESALSLPIFSARKVIELKLNDLFAMPISQENKKNQILELLKAALQTAAKARYPLFLACVSEKHFDFTDFGLGANDLALKVFESGTGAKPLKVRAIEFIRSKGKRIRESDLDLWLGAKESEEIFWNELEQTLLRLGENVEITRLHIEPFLDREIEKNIFAFSDAIGRRDIARTLLLIHQMIEFGDEAVPSILGRILSILNQIRAARTILDRTIARPERYAVDKNGIRSFPDALVSQCQSTARAGLEKTICLRHPYALKALLTAAMRFSIDELGKISSQLLDYDFRSKSSGIPTEYSFEIHMTRLLGPWVRERAVV